MVIDYRALNKVTIKDSLPHVTHPSTSRTFYKALTGSLGWIVSEPFTKSRWLTKRSRDLTTFRGPSGGLYRYRYMPMGLVNAMAIWSRFIDTTMAGMDDFVLCCADDVLVFTKSSKWKIISANLEKVVPTA